jgi:hypothetical protein
MRLSVGLAGQHYAVLLIQAAGFDIFALFVHAWPRLIPRHPRAGRFERN